ncbi:hypothetical protein [Tamlana sp. I1]|uniref:hypothetical protein n=1 Tax=Tamlana sp. I1 TaxID=2762061 RepID=UPI00188DF004|nr:hypothetical protein [Tamlana sp. I1]
MKNSIRIWNVILLTAIYCFTIGLAAKSIVPSNNSSSRTTIQEKHFSTTLFCDTSQFEYSINEVNNLPTADFDKLFKVFFVGTKITEQFLKTAYSQYVILSRNLLIKHRKSDVIFPFHYFW